MEVGKKYFEELIDKMKERKGVTYDVELSAADELSETGRGAGGFGSTGRG